MRIENATGMALVPVARAFAVALSIGGCATAAGDRARPGPSGPERPTPPAATVPVPRAPGPAPAPSGAPSPPGGASAPRYLALGDSFTIAAGGPAKAGFPERFVAHQSCGVALLNVAVNGYSTQDLIDDELPELTRFAPTFVTLAVGANDIVRGVSPSTYRQNLRTIFAAVVAARVQRVVVLPQPDWARSPAAVAFGAASLLHARIEEANAILGDESARAGATYLDLAGSMQVEAERGMIAGDGLHRSGAAYDAWALELERSLPRLCGS